MTWVKWVTDIGLLVIAGLIVFWDVAALALAKAFNLKAVMVSESMRDYGHQSFMIPFVWGLLASHFWWNASFIPPWWVKLIGLTVIAAVLLTFDIYTGVTKDTFKIVRLIQDHPMVVFACGIFIGRAVWPQPYS